MCVSPQGAGRTQSPPRCPLTSGRDVREIDTVAVVAVRLGSLVLILRRYRTNSPKFDLVPTPGSRLRDLSHELLTDEVLQGNARLLVEVAAQARLEDRPGFGALLNLAGVLVAVGVIGEGVAVVLSADDPELQADLQAIGLCLVRGQDLQSAHLLRDYFLWREA